MIHGVEFHGCLHPAAQHIRGVKDRCGICPSCGDDPPQVNDVFEEDRKGGE